jgi:hypothetical protein
LDEEQDLEEDFEPLLDFEPLFDLDFEPLLDFEPDFEREQDLDLEGSSGWQGSHESQGSHAGGVGGSHGGGVGGSHGSHGSHGGGAGGSQTGRAGLQIGNLILILILGPQLSFGRGAQTGGFGGWQTRQPASADFSVRTTIDGAAMRAATPRPRRRRALRRARGIFGVLTCFSCG